MYLITHTDLLVLHSRQSLCAPVQVSVLEPEFLACGGDVKWLHGLHHLPPKLYNLLKLNRLLAHQPWNVSPGDIKVGTGGREGEG